MDFKRKPMKHPTLFQFEDSMSLLRKRQETKEMRGDLGNTTPLCLNKSPNQATGMTTLCTINDDGLDALQSDDETDSSIENVRDACTSSFATGNLLLPDIVVQKPKESPYQDIVEDPLHFNIKNSTMNRSSIQADLNDINVHNLSPIAKCKKRKRKALDADKQSLYAFGESRDATASSESSPTGTTPRHIRAFMNKLKAVDKKHDTDDISESIDCNNNSEKHATTQQKSVHEFGESGELSEEEEWSPTKMVRRPLITRNWLHPNDTDNVDDKICTYMKSNNVVPSWKKQIKKPEPRTQNLTFRTSSPSPYCHSKNVSPKQKKSILQISSIRELDSNVSMSLNFETFSKYTINSDEIAPFSTFSILANTTAPSIGITEDEILLDNEIELSKIETEQNHIDEESVPESKSCENIQTEQENAKEADFLLSSKVAVRSPVGQNLSDDTSSVTHIAKQAHKNGGAGDQVINCSVESDIFSRLPSPLFVCKHTGKKAPSYHNIPNDEICSSE